MQHKNIGFSLLELMSVISIIAILATVAIPNYRAYIIRGEVAAGFSVINDYTAKLISYYNDNSVMPPASALDDYTFSTDGSYERAAINASNIANIYYWNHPTDPRANIIFEYQTNLLPDDNFRRIFVAVSCNSQDICRKFCGWESTTQSDYMEHKYAPANCKDENVNLIANTFAAQ